MTVAQAQRLMTHFSKRDFLLLAIMAIGAACGMIYEYLIAHYAGRIIGSVDTAVYGMIGLMVVAMGLGAFYSRTVRCPYTGFAWLEVLIALIGGSAVLMMAALFALSYVLPIQLQHAFGLHETVNVHGGPVFMLKQFAETAPYLIGLLIGFLIGMEIPFIARIRQELHDDRLEHNAGTVYGADYIGGGAGAAIWILFCLNQPIIVSAALTALLNLVLGGIFLAYFHKRIKALRFLIPLKLVSFSFLLLILVNGSSWMNSMSNMLYSDRVVHSVNTKYQSLVLTQKPTGTTYPPVTNLYINGHLQFSSSDEIIYHSYLVVPALLASARQNNILIVGGGDGLAAREVLRWSPESVTLIDLDPTMIDIFQGKNVDLPAWLSTRLVGLNGNSLNDPRMNFMFGDAFKVVESLSGTGQYFDAIIVDLPDPNHPDLNKLYTDYFYAKLSDLLSADGVIAIQSTSPYHSKKAFLSIGKTVESTGLLVDQYHANVPSFGDWGWTIAAKAGATPKERLLSYKEMPVDHPYLSLDQVMAGFAFSNSFYHQASQVDINRLNEPTLYAYHSEGWRKHKGIYIAK